MNLNTEQRARVTIKPLTAGGHPARIDGAVSFSSSDESIIRVEAIDDMNAYIYGVAVGTARVVATFDADLDATEVRTLEYDGDVTVVEAEAESAEATYGEPELVLTPVGEPPVENPPADGGDDVPPTTDEPPVDGGDEGGDEEPPAEEPPAEEPPADGGDEGGDTGDTDGGDEGGEEDPAP
jgi:hypothetical protein